MKYRYSMDTMLRIRQEIMTYNNSRDEQIHGSDVLILKVDKEEDNKLYGKRARDSLNDDLKKKQPKPFHFQRHTKNLKGLEMMRGYKDSHKSHESFEMVCLGLPLKRLGLFLKPEYALGDDDCEDPTSNKQIHDQEVLIPKVEEEENRRQNKRVLDLTDDNIVKKQQKKAVEMPQPFHFQRDIKSLKGLEMSRGYKDSHIKDSHMSHESFEIVCLGLPLKRLGLFLKPEYALGDDEEE